MQLVTALRNSIVDAIDSYMDTGTNPEARFLNAAGTAAYATAPLSTTNVFSTPTASATSISLNGSATSTGSVTSGTVGRIGFYINATAAVGAWDILFGVATSGGPDITMPDNTLTTADTVKITSLTVTCPAGTPDTT